MAKDNTLICIIILLIGIIIYLSATILTGVNEIPLSDNNIISNTSNNEIKWSVPDGFIKIDSVSVEGNTVIITKNCTGIIAQTSEERASGLANALNNVTDTRPDVYESIASVLQSFDIRMEAVLVHRFESDTFFADAYFRIGNNLLQLDMKPSDAMAIALRQGSSIYYNQTLFEQLGENIC